MQVELEKGYMTVFMNVGMIRRREAVLSCAD